MERSASEFLRALRGGRSQVQLARRLGYRANPITDWERGQRFPTAHEALRVAALSGVDVPAAFARFAAHIPLRTQAGALSLGAWLDALRGATPLSELSRRSGLSRFSVSRWLKGTAKPRLPEFFLLLDAITGRLPEWVAELVDIHTVPSLLARFQAGSEAKRLAFEAPWTEAVLRLLETRAYRESRTSTAEFIAGALGISREEVAVCLERLLRAAVIEKRGRRYRVHQQGTVDTQASKEAMNLLKAHWTRVALGRLAAPRDQDFFAYNVISLSASDLGKVRDKLRASFREIRSLVAASQPEEVAAVINLQVVSFLPP